MSIVSIDPLHAEIVGSPCLLIALVAGSSDVVHGVYIRATGQLGVALVDSFVTSVRFDFAKESWVDIQAAAAEQLEPPDEEEP